MSHITAARRLCFTDVVTMSYKMKALRHSRGAFFVIITGKGVLLWPQK